MRIINKRYRFRICPNKEQEVLLNKHLGSSCFVYNYFLNERKDFAKVNRFYPSSKSCSFSTLINQNLKVSDREATCNFSQVVKQRDLNASLNILKKGLKIYDQEVSIRNLENYYLGSSSIELQAHLIALACVGSAL